VPGQFYAPSFNRGRNILQRVDITKLLTVQPSAPSCVQTFPPSLHLSCAVTSHNHTKQQVKLLCTPLLLFASYRPNNSLLCYFVFTAPVLRSSCAEGRSKKTVLAARVRIHDAWPQRKWLLCAKARAHFRNECIDYAHFMQPDVS
jgi:hypothetical protein